MNRIAELRKKYGISQKELAKKFGLAQNTLSQYENELRTPSTEMITRMADFFEVSVNYLLGIPKEPENHSTLDSLDYRNVTKITRTWESDETNILISIGWKLLHVGEDRHVSYDGSGYSGTVFTLGWYGDPLKAIIPDFERDLEAEHYANEWRPGDPPLDN